MMKLVVANPLAPSTVVTIPPAKRVGDLTGKTIGLYWNIKAGGDAALDQVERLLGQRYQDVSFVRLVGSIGSTVRHLTPADTDKIAASCDAVVGTTGD
jgi:hypothetical protein